MDSPGAGGPPFSRSLTHRAGLLPATNPDRFATLGWWVNRPLFLPKLHRGSHLQLLIRGAAVRFSFWVLPGVAALSGGSGEAAGGMIMPPHGGSGSKPPDTPLVTFVVKRKSPGCRAERLQVGAGTAVRKSPRGAGRSARPRGLWGQSPPRSSRVPTHPR